jgi:hypothetical protein
MKHTKSDCHIVLPVLMSMDTLRHEDTDENLKLQLNS